MVRTNKSVLLDQFLNEKVSVVLSINTLFPLPDGDVLEAPMISEGILVDYDASFILLGQRDRDALELIKRDSIVGIKQIDDFGNMLDSMPTPESGNFN